MENIGKKKVTIKNEDGTEDVLIADEVRYHLKYCIVTTGDMQTLYERSRVSVQDIQDVQEDAVETAEEK
jgi:hypothetical protein